ncbi:MAG TPA: type II toxin-antitoxin system RelE/ParE family toxin [Thermoanaerobaculia bacterium]
MAHSRLGFHPEAVLEVEEARSWYEQRSLAAAVGFEAELAHAVDQVSLAPSRWPRYRAGTRRYVFRRYPYSLIYTVEDDRVEILAVAQDKRRAGYWISRA